ncbi:hypothetical protein HYW60_01755 [Candidatus Kaiserbacteria bacterium]|nr:hypothetical protein [Candidatus Kaiserbacteria bacterium]
MTLPRTRILFVLILVASCAIVALSVDIASAQVFVPLESFGDSPKLRGAYSETELGPFMNRVFVGAIAAGAILAVLRLAWAGFVYMSSDLWTSKDRAKEIIRDTLLGLFLLLAVWLILYQINPDILKLEIGFREGANVGGGRTAPPLY